MVFYTDVALQLEYMAALTVETTILPFHLSVLRFSEPSALCLTAQLEYKS